MGKTHNMGRRAHMTQDTQLHETEPARRAAEETGQTVRPTQHPSQPVKSSGQGPQVRHSRRGE